MNKYSNLNTCNYWFLQKRCGLYTYLGPSPNYPQALLIHSCLWNNNREKYKT